MTDLKPKTLVYARIRKQWRPAVVVCHCFSHVVVKTRRGKKEYTLPATRRFVRLDPPMRQMTLNLWGGVRWRLA